MRWKTPPEPPPHTRGSTWLNHSSFGSSVASPAHAGIDLVGTETVPDALGLPRTRGDRPDVAVGQYDVRVPPPHTRGSTLILSFGAERGVASPAHAGIDPPVSDHARHSSRLPRTRGDRPKSDYWKGPMAAPPPHTRGSTRQSTRLGRKCIASPAHAGIDLELVRAAHRCRRLPRTRGDRPPLKAGGHGHGTPPPHTRGST